MSHKGSNEAAEIEQIKAENAMLGGYRQMCADLLAAETQEELARAAGERLRALFAARGGIVEVVEADGGRRKVVWEEDEADSPGSVLPESLRQKVVAEAMASCRQVATDKAEKYFAQLGEEPQTALRDLVALPLEATGGLGGVVILYNFATKDNFKFCAEQGAIFTKLLANALGRLAREHARELERQLVDRLFESTEAKVACLDVDFNFLRVNSVYEKECGYANEELAGRNHFEFFPDEETEAIFRQVVASGDAVEFQEKPFLCPGEPARGTTFWNWKLAPIKDEQGQVVRLLLSMHDVTEKVESREQMEAAEQARAREEHLLATILDNARPHMAYLDRELRFIRANASYAEVTGYTSEELAGKRHFEVWQNPQGTADLEHVLRTGETVFRREHVHYHPQRGKTFWDWSAAPVASEGRIVEGILISAVDVTEQVQARERIAAAEREQAREARLLETVVENTDSPMAYLDRDLRILQVNSAYCRSANYSKEELIGHIYSELFPLASIGPILVNVRDSGERFESRETPRRMISRPELGVTYWDSVVIPVKDQNGDVEGIVISSVDVTEHVRTRERMLAAERERTRLAENLTVEVNHRMKNNLSMVAGLLQLQISRATEVTSAVDIVADAIARIRTFAAVHEQLYERQAESVELLDAARRIARIAGESLSQENVDLQVSGKAVSYPPRTAMTICVVINELITNAIKHGAPDADGRHKVEACVEVRDNRLCLSVANSGKPVAADFEITKDWKMGLRLIHDMAVGRYRGKFAICPRRGGTVAEIEIEDDRLRQES